MMEHAVHVKLVSMEIPVSWNVMDVSAEHVIRTTALAQTAASLVCMVTNVRIAVPNVYMADVIS